MPTYTRIPYAQTHRFSTLVEDYLRQAPELRSCYEFAGTEDGLAAAIAARSTYPVDRAALVKVLTEQYSHLPPADAVTTNLGLLSSENTFTVCTAHQPNLATGYLYFIYKILHAVSLAKQLKQLHPKLDFVPVYYMGSEDNDLEELGTFRYADKKYVWEAESQTGAVGRMKTKSLKPLLEDLFKVLGPPGDAADELKEMLVAAYLHHDTITAATRYLVHQLFGRFGVVVLDADDARLKKSFVDVMKDELLHSTAEQLILNPAKSVFNIPGSKEKDAPYTLQAVPRNINLFYLKDNLRERIERTAEDNWVVVNTELSWPREHLLQELDSFPERFSPNVILRPLYQETILPNVAFIGGGSEVAYWLELGEVFKKYEVFYPAVMLRQSVWWVNAEARAKLTALDLEPEDLFADENEIHRMLIDKNAPAGWDTATERDALEYLMDAVREKAMLVDGTLERAADAALKKMDNQLIKIEKKIARAYKRQMEVPIARLEKIMQSGFPGGGLQERSENFMGYYLAYGPQWLDAILNGIAPFQHKFLIVDATETLSLT